MYTTRFAAVCALLAAAIMLTGCAEQPQVATQPGAVWTIDEALLTATTADSPADLETRKKMRVRVPQLDVSGLKFKDVTGFLRDMGEVNIVVNWGALQAAGIDASTEVGEIKLTNVTFEKALTTVLETVGGGQVDLRHVVDGNVITISTKEELEAKAGRGPTVTRVYDVRDLIDEARPAKWDKTLIRELIAEALRRPVPKSAAPVPVRGQHPTLAHLYRVRVAELADAIDKQLRNRRARDLMQAIRLGIAPYSWRTYQSGLERMQEFNGLLVINHTDDVHRQIARLLSVLRRQAAPIGAQGERDDKAPGVTTPPAK